MKHRKYRGAQAFSPAPHDGDIDPSAFFGRARGRTHRPPRADHKTQQLCRQAFRALTSALGGECGDPLLQILVVHAVSPAPNAGRLLVDVYAGPGAGEDPPHEILRRLHDVDGLLRHAVAEAIVRKRAPDLIFRVVTPGFDHEEGRP